MQSNNIAPEWQKLFDTVGVTPDQLQDKDTAQFIYDYVEKQGGIQKWAETEGKKGKTLGLAVCDVHSPESFQTCRSGAWAALLYKLVLGQT